MTDNAERAKKNEGPLRKVRLSMTFRHFELPPIRDALIIGKRAPVGPKGVERAFRELTPGMFRMLHVDHPTIEAILVRESDLRKIPKDKLVSKILEHAETFMSEEDSLHVMLQIEVIVDDIQVEI